MKLSNIVIALAASAPAVCDAFAPSSSLKISERVNSSFKTVDFPTLLSMSDVSEINLGDSILCS